MNNQNDYYQILGIPPNAKIDIIKKAYREKALRYHPDRGGTHEQMLLINEAWAILSDPARRKLYDNAQINRTNEAVQKEASVDREYARRDASDYPRNWTNFQEWMEEAFGRVESKKLGPGLVIPNPKKDIIGWIFVITGGLFTVYLTVLMGFTRTGSAVFTIIRFLIFSVGGWLGWLVYQFFIDFFVNKSDKVYKYNKPIKRATITGGIIVLCLFIVIALVGKTEKASNQGIKNKDYFPPQQAPLYSAPTSPIAPSAAPSKTLTDSTLTPAKPPPNFRYNGYLSSDDKRSALVNGNLYQEGDSLGDNNEYVLKSIHPNHIIMRNKIDKSEINFILYTEQR